MKTIKKVAVTPLPENEAKVIDSENTSDNKRLNTYSMRIIDEKVSNLNTSKQSKVLTGTTNPSSSLGNNGDIYLKYSS